MSKEQVQENLNKIVRFLQTSEQYKHHKQLIADLSSIDVQTASSSSRENTDEELTRGLLTRNMQSITRKVKDKIIADCMSHLSSATTIANADNTSIIWSWLLRTSAMLSSSMTLVLPIVVKRTFDLGRLNALPRDLLRETMSYLSLPEQETLLIRKRHTSHTLFRLDNHAALNEEHLLEKFSYLIAREGKDNQNKAEKILKQYPHLAEKLISKQQNMSDPTRHFIKSMSAYEYAYWSGDTRMRHMMEKYMDENTKAIVYAQCKNVAEHGVEFEEIVNGKIAPNSKISHSKHFDFQPLIDAYNAYIAEATRLINANNWDDSAWIEADKLWLNIGKELAKVPIHVAQEYCSDQPFYPLDKYQETLQKPTFKRIVTFQNWMSNKVESWFSGAGPNPGLGVLFSMFKGRALLAAAGRRGAMRAWGDRSTFVAVSSDCAAVTALCKARTDDDLKQTLDDLKPAELGSHLRL